MKSLLGLGLLAVALTVAHPLTADTADSPIDDPAVTGSLMEVYQRALQNDPGIREAEAIYRAEVEARPQARSALLPQLTASASQGWSESSGSSTFQSVREEDGARIVEMETSEFEQTRRSRQWQVQLRQTLFRWDQWLAFRRADKHVARAEIDFEVAQQDLMLRTADAYFAALAAQDVLSSARATQEAIAEQLEQAERRFEVGLTAITDVQEARAAHDRSAADVIAAERTLASTREALRELTGDYIEELSRLDRELPLTPPTPTSEAAWVDTALAQNLALTAARIGADMARDDVNISRTGHYPTLDLVASHSSSVSRSERSNDQQPFRPADSDDRGGSISLQLSIPLFRGGATSSEVRQSVQRHRASREAVERVSRQTEREARDAYLGVISDLSRVRALRQAVRSSETALEATETGLEVGTRTTVDVLEGRRQLFQAQTEYAQSRYDYVLNTLRLKRSAGVLTPQDLAEINDWLED